MKNELIERLRREMPVIFARSEVDALTGRVCRARTMANLDCRGEGPRGSYRQGKNVIYSREPFLEWLSDRLVEIDRPTKVG